MFEFDPFDMDMDGDVDGMDFLGFDYLMRHVLDRDNKEDEEECDTQNDDISRSIGEL